QNAGKNLRKRSARFYGKVVTIMISTYFLSNVTALWVEEWIPDPKPTSLKPAARSFDPASARRHEAIITRNLFNRKGLIPGEESDRPAIGGPAVRTSLPFRLIGTIILEDSVRSLGTIE